LIRRKCWTGGVTGQHIEPEERSNMNEIPLEFSYACYTCNITVRDTDYVYLVERMKAHFQNMHGKDVSFQGEPTRVSFQSERTRKDAMRLYDPSEYNVEETARKMKEMGIISSQRIGWDQKQESLELLAELSANGYLTSEEWETRTTAVQNAQAQEDIDLVFMDLRSAKTKLILAKGLAESKKTPKPKVSLSTYSKMAFPVAMVFFDLTWMFVDAQNGVWWGVALMALCAVSMIILAVKTWKRK
jgi:Domain of unknown function (DUF1707)